MPTPADLLETATGKVRERAGALRGTVRRRTREGEVLRASVQGSEAAPYRAWVNLKAGTWACSCPDDINLMCKHVTALPLTARDNPDSFLPVTAGRRLPDVKGWADGDVERLLERLLKAHPRTVTDWARVVAEERFDQQDELEDNDQV